MKVVVVMLEVRAGGGWQKWAPQLQGVGDDRPRVLALERIEEVCKALKLVVDILSLADEEVLHE
jgi:hypothetical protein